MLITSFILSSCSATQPLLAEALIEKPSVESRLILERAVGDLLNSQPPKLSSHVFTQRSTVIIERNQPKNSRGNLLDGREVRPADTISLLIEAQKCYLKHDQSGAIKPIINIKCRAK